MRGSVRRVTQRVGIVLLLGFLLIWAPATLAHLLNMSYSTVELASDGAVNVELRLDLLKTAGSREAYYELSQLDAELTNPQIAELLASLPDAVSVVVGNQPIPLKVRSIVFSDVSRERYLDPFEWPRATVHLSGRAIAKPTEGALLVTYTDEFLFEEPIANTIIDLSNGRSQTRWLVTNQRSPTFDASSWAGTASGIPRPEPADWGGVISFAKAGFTHILPFGADHLLFVAALLLGARSVRSLIVVITAFTLAHSLTLAASVLGWVDAPPFWVETGIVLSIAWMAWINLKTSKPAHSVAIVMFFGLLHGFGFASALSALDLPADQRLLTLFAFNVGVELGQLTFLALLIAALSWHARRVSPTEYNDVLPIGGVLRRRGSMLILAIAAVLLIRLAATAVFN